MSKQDKVKRDLLKGQKISGLTAWKRYGLYRLSSAINRLRKMRGTKKILTELRSYNGDQYAVYYLPNKRK